MIAVYVASLTSGEECLPEIGTAIRCLSYFQKANLENRYLKKEEFVNETVSSSLSMQYIAKQYYLKNKNIATSEISLDFVFLDYPWIFSTAAKVDVLQHESSFI